MGVKLSEIFERYERIKQLDSHLPKEVMLSYINNYNQQIENLKFIESQELKNLEKDLLDKINLYLELTVKIQNKLKTTIDSNQREYLEINKKIWKTNLEKMTFFEHLIWEKLWPPTEIEFQYFISQIKQYNNWQYPGLVFGAKTSSILKSLVGLEPIYIVERYSEYFNLHKEKFPSSFAKKLRCYNLDNIHLLPPNSIGISVVYNEFNFLPWNITSHILTKLAKSIKPDGILIFNYNNCDTARGFKEFETWSMTYTTSKMFTDFLSKYDFTLINKYTSSRETFSFMTLKKNGHVPLIKKSPSIGYVKQQSFVHTPQHETKLKTIHKLIDPE